MRSLLTKAKARPLRAFALIYEALSLPMGLATSGSVEFKVLMTWRCYLEKTLEVQTAGSTF
jgi:hypothetical protein